MRKLMLAGVLTAVGVGLLASSAPAATRASVTRTYVALGDSLSNGYIDSSQATSKGFVGRLYTGYQTSLSVNQLLDVAQDGASTTSLRNGGQLASGLADINAATDTKAVTIDIGGYEAFFGGPCPGHWTQSTVCPVRANLAYILGQLKTALINDPGTELFAAMAYYNPSSGTANAASVDKTLLGNNLKVGCSDKGLNVGLNDLVYQEAGKLGIAVADPYPAFKKKGQAFMSQTDSLHVHPNDRGYVAIANAFKSPSRLCG